MTFSFVGGFVRTSSFIAVNFFHFVHNENKFILRNKSIRQNIRDVDIDGGYFSFSQYFHFVVSIRLSREFPIDQFGNKYTRSTSYSHSFSCESHMSWGDSHQRAYMLPKHVETPTNYHILSNAVKVLIWP